MDLRDYQVECIGAVLKDWGEVNSVLCSLAVGSGKTVIFLDILNRVMRESGKRAMIIAHTRELIYQPIERAESFYPALAPRMGIVMADTNDVSAAVIVGTIQSLVSGSRLQRIIGHGKIDYLIIDETHHATASTYSQLITRLKIGNPKLKIAGFTATPKRTDGDGLSKVFERISYRFPINIAIKRGALCPFDALGIEVPVSFEGLAENENGWESDPAGDLLSASNVLEVVYGKWAELAKERLTIGFTASVAQAEKSAAYFNDHGTPAAFVSGMTPKEDRARIIADYTSGKIRVLFNCMVLTEGVDIPETSAILMIAPTKSDLIYGQRLGRGLRVFPQKENCLVLDFAPSHARDLVMAGDILGKPRKVKKAEEKAARSGILSAFSMDKYGDSHAVDPEELVIKILDLLRVSHLAWTVRDNYATASLGAGVSACIVMPDPARIQKARELKAAGVDWPEAYEKRLALISSYNLVIAENSKAPRLAGSYPDFEQAKETADQLAEELDDPISKKSTSWRKDPSATEAQLGFMKRMGIPIPEKCTKGIASQLIAEKLAISAARKVLRL